METGVHGALLLPHAFFPLMHPSLASKRCWECPAGGQHRCSWAGWLAVLGPSSPLAAQGSMEARRRTGVGCGFFSCCFLAFCPLSYDRKWYFAKQLAAQQLGAQEGWEKQCGVWDGGGVLPLLPQSTAAAQAVMAPALLPQPSLCALPLQLLPFPWAHPSSSPCPSHPYALSLLSALELWRCRWDPWCQQTHGPILLPPLPFCWHAQTELHVP